ncbi:AAA family ATPase [Crateriforma spongiae]|uniref:AAA family ATPase n=1 Tax=Crateriforma spongiae TaxID=2724528 RepID=UPI0028F44CC6|nr:AAA family ATPase [Crateriforma spongiae]
MIDPERSGKTNGMIRKIKLKNFMSHRSTEIELADGLTVLTGPNNCGKSAIVAALQVLASNGRTTHVTRHGAKESSVTVETDDGQNVTWRRRSGVSYTINGKDIGRVGQATPESLHDVLRLAKVSGDNGKAEYDIHFGEQKSPVFLLNESGNRAATFFASSSDAALLIAMQNRHRNRHREVKSEHRRLTQDLTQVDQRLAAYQPLDDLSQRLDAAEAKGNAVQDQAKRIERIQQLLRQLSRTQERCRELISQQSVLQRLDTSPHRAETLASSFNRAQSLRLTLQRMQRAESTRNRAQSVRKALRTLAEPPTVRDVRPITQSIRGILSVTQRRSQCERLDRSLSGLKPPPDMRPAQRCQSMVAELERLQTRCVRLNAVHRSLAALVSPPATIETKPLVRLIATLGRLQTDRRRFAQIVDSLNRLDAVPVARDASLLSQTRSRLVAAEAAVAAQKEKLQAAQTLKDAAVKRLESWVQQHPRCETCGQQINVNDLMSTMPQLHQHPDQPH